MHKALLIMDGLYALYRPSGKPENGILFLPMLKSAGRDINKLYRAIRKIWLSSPLPGKRIWLADWVDVIEDYDIIILSDYGNSPNVCRYIHDNYPAKRIIVWYHNPIEVSVSPESFDRSYCDLWSFDPDDCEKYGLSYNPQFYIPSATFHDETIDCDAFYVGAEKGRGNVLKEMEHALNGLGFRCEFDIVGVNSASMPYAEVIKRIERSKAIVDCLSPWQSGMTLRPLEAMFYSKKLITNQVTIKDMDFYYPENVFVWGDDSPSGLEAFMSSPVKAVPDAVKRSYGLEGWLGRFGLA
jgi:hypothetical protein